MNPQPSDTALPGRIDLVDLARGIALLAMFVFHFAYDLSFYGLIAVDVPADQAWRWFARLIAGSFLTLVGVSLVLTARNGLNRKAYAIRLAKVAGAAALVTLGTWFAMRESFIFFGILHHVALAGVLALPFLRRPSWVLALSAMLAFAMPMIVAHPALDLPFLDQSVVDQPWLIWLGLSDLPVRTADFVPVFPWFGCVLAGMWLGRLALANPAGWMMARVTAKPARLIAWGGRNSLLVYLVHQPVFIGMILLAMRLMTIAMPAQEERPFMVSCQRSCVASGSALEACTALCGCTIEGLKRENLWQKVLDNAMSAQESAKTGAIARACLRQP